MEKKEIVGIGIKVALLYKVLTSLLQFAFLLLINQGAMSLNKPGLMLDFYLLLEGLICLILYLLTSQILKGQEYTKPIKYVIAGVLVAFEGVRGLIYNIFHYFSMTVVSRGTLLESKLLESKKVWIIYFVFLMLFGVVASILAYRKMDKNYMTLQQIELEEFND